MRTSSKARAGAVAGVLAASLALAGCGDLTSTEGPVTNSADAPHLTREQLAPAMTSAIADAGAMHVRLRATFEGKETTAEADASMTPGGSIRITVRDGLGLYGRPTKRTFELRLIANMIYLTAAKPGKFFEADVSDSGTLCGCIARELRRAASPTGSMENFRRALVGSEFVGLEARDGRYLQHYRLEFDPRRVVSAKWAQRLKKNERFHYDMWLDSDNLVHRMSGEAFGLKMVATYSDWGKRIDLNAPWPKQIVNAAQF